MLPTIFGMSGCSAAWLARLTGGQKVVSSTLIIPTIFLYLSHHSPLDDAFFISRYIPFNPRVVQRIFLSKILRRETFSAPFGRRRTHSSPEILRLRKGSPSRFFELRRKVRADSPTATICLRNSAYMIFRFWGIARLGFTSKAENTPRCFLGITCVLRVAHHYLECCFPKTFPPPKVQKMNSRIFDSLRKTENGFFGLYEANE